MSGNVDKCQDEMDEELDDAPELYDYLEDEDFVPVPTRHRALMEGEEVPLPPSMFEQMELAWCANHREQSRNRPPR